MTLKENIREYLVGPDRRRDYRVQRELIDQYLELHPWKKTFRRAHLLMRKCSYRAAFYACSALTLYSLYQDMQKYSGIGAIIAVGSELFRSVLRNNRMGEKRMLVCVRQSVLTGKSLEQLAQEAAADQREQERELAAFQALFNAADPDDPADRWKLG